jgi:hypothetical protein
MLCARRAGGTIDKFELLNALDRLGKTKEEVHPALRRLACRQSATAWLRALPDRLPSRSRDAAVLSNR